MRPHSVPTREFFEAEADRYTSRSDTGFWGWWRRREKRAVWRLLSPRPGERILDAGSGTGYYARALRDGDARVVAADFAPAMAKGVAGTLRIPAVAADLHRPFVRPVFDAVLCAGALEFCDDPERALSRLAEALSPTPGSRVVAMLPSAGFTGWLYQRYHGRHGLRLQTFPPDRIRRMARGAGLRVDAAGVVGFNYVLRFRPLAGAASPSEKP